MKEELRKKLKEKLKESLRPILKKKLRAKYLRELIGEPPRNIDQNKSIEELELSVRSYNALMGKGIFIIEKLLNLSDKELFQIEYLGKTSVAEIKSKLHSYIRRMEEKIEKEQEKSESIYSFTDQLLSILPSKDRGIVEERFGLWDGIERTLEDIGRRFGLTREGIRQIKIKAIKIFVTVQVL
ncbi:MAG: DNA-directed RNA polymerase subunit alpha C-terminal domain-containing protein [Candidatus Desantisbacteria bacterium]